VTTGKTRAAIYAGAAALLAVVTWLDYITGYELGFFVFYFAPVALAAWYGTRRAGLAIAIAAGACWYLSDSLTNHPYSSAYLIYWETFMRLVSFVSTALTLSQIRSDLRKREELLDVVSHDLRSPLGALVGQAQLLGRRAGDDAFVKARVEAILRCAARMDSMIEDILDSAKLEARQLQLHLGPIDVGACLSALVAETMSDRLQLRLEDAGDLLVRADINRLERVVMNLVGNALKFSPENAPVQLGASRDGAWVTIRVEDRGPGIPSEDLPFVFDKFYRGRNGVGRGGSGLGLYSVRLLVEAHGGRVWAGPGRAGGSAFQVALPALQATGTAHVPGLSREATG
jgi:signal transduction histidine kinase